MQHGRTTVGRRSLRVAFVAIVALIATLGPSPAVRGIEPPSGGPKDATVRCQTDLLGSSAPDVQSLCVGLLTPTAVTALPSGFTETVVWSGLNNPTAIRFAADGRVFVAEKSGVIKVFDDLSDATPTVFAGLTTNVQDYWDRGLLGLALDPSLTGGGGATGPYVYLLYTYDHILGSTAPAPRWGDACPGVPGPTTDGCVVSGRLSRFQVTGTVINGPEQVLIEDWCQQFPSHSIGSIAFGSDGALYVSGGDGASFNGVDYGQLGGSLSGTPTSVNPCGDPPGGAMTPPTAEGGALRSQDVRTLSAPTGGTGTYAQTILADRPVGYWRLGEASGTQAVDLTGSNSGTYIGGPTLGVAGPLVGDSDTAVELDGGSQYISVPDSASLDWGDTFSVEAWVKRNGGLGVDYRYIVSKGTQVGLSFNNADRVLFDNDGSVGSTSAVAINDTSWHHIVATRRPGVDKIYVDGVDVTTPGTQDDRSSSADALEIGRYIGSSDYFPGSIDEVAVYNVTLSPEQVAAHHLAGSAGGAPSGTADPTSLDGAILRIDPTTGAAMPDNPMIGSADPNARRIIAYGLRNPFRFTLRPNTNELWLGDVGWSTWEEVNRVADVTDGVVENFGWPCYEGAARQSGYDSANVSLCEDLYAAGTSAITAPVYAYDHADKVISGETCPAGSSAIAGMAFYPESGGSFPAAYRGGLFFADHNRSCIWFMPKGSNGQPDPNQRQAFAPGAANPVDLQIGPNGDLFYVDFDTSSIRRISVVGANQSPTARIVATPESGTVPLTVDFDGQTSTDPEGGTLTYRWDLDGDGAYDDSTSATPSWQYTSAGAVTVRLEVTDPASNIGTTTKVITAGAANTPPVPDISTPEVGTTWSVGQSINFSGSATDAEDGVLAAPMLSWSLVLQHCPSNCHPHQIQTFPGLASGSFATPDHEYPSYLELTITATDSAGASAAVTRQLDPRTVSLNFATEPAGLDLTVGGETEAAPFSRTVIEDSLNSISAPTPQTTGGLSYGFTGWSDGGAASHDITATASGGSYTATYAAASTDINVIKTGSRSGSTVTYVVTVSHVSGLTAQAVTMTDVLPNKLDYVSATSTRGTCGATGLTVTCAIGSLASGQTATITIVTQPVRGKGRITNTANVSTSTPELVTDNNQSSFSLKL